MYLDKYLTRLCKDADIETRVIRVKDITTREGFNCYDVILIPHAMDEEGVIYKIEFDLEEIKERLILYPSQFAVLGAWVLNDLIKGAMYMEGTIADYFASEV